MKKFLLIILCLQPLAFAESVGMSPESDVMIHSTWWGGEVFYQNGSPLKVTSMFSVLDAYQSSTTWAKKAKIYYIPSIILASGGVVMMVVPPISKGLGNKFNMGMFIGGGLLTTAGLGLFKLSNVYLARAVRSYKKESGLNASVWEFDLLIIPEGLKLAADLHF
jgi:hypothetical protein